MVFAVIMDQDQALRNVGRVFDPYCLITIIKLFWKLAVLHGMTYILRISRFCQFYKLSQSFWKALYTNFYPDTYTVESRYLELG